MTKDKIIESLQNTHDELCEEIEQLKEANIKHRDELTTCREVYNEALVDKALKANRIVELENVSKDLLSELEYQRDKLPKDNDRIVDRMYILKHSLQ